MPKPLNRRTALARARKVFGRGGAAHDNGKPSSPEDRASARVVCDELARTKPTIPDLHDWPASATIGEYRASLAQHRTAMIAWKARQQNALGRLMHYRYTVGIAGAFFMVEGEGDSWEEAFTDAARRRALYNRGTNA